MEPESIGVVLKKSPIGGQAKALSSEAWAQEQAQQEARRKAERREALWQEAGVDDRHGKKDTNELMQNIPWAAMVLKAWHLIQKGAPILGFLGDRGNGKTQAAALIIRKAVYEERSARYLRCRQVGMAIRAAYRADALTTEDQALRRLTEPWLLVLDECQERFDTDHELQTLTLLLDLRYGACRPTILVANMAEVAFCELMGAAVVDRMREGGGTMVFEGASFRTGKGEVR